MQKAGAQAVYPMRMSLVGGVPWHEQKFQQSEWLVEGRYGSALTSLDPEARSQIKSPWQK